MENIKTVANLPKSEPLSKFISKSDHAMQPGRVGENLKTVSQFPC